MASERHGDGVPLLGVAEKRHPESLESLAPPNPRQPQQGRKMSPRSKVVFMLTLCLLAAFGMASAVVPRKNWSWRPCHRGQLVEQGRAPDANEASILSSLEEASPDSLQSLIHTLFPGKLRHGVFSTEHDAAAEAAQDADADAPVVVQIVKRDGNTTSSDSVTLSSTSSTSSQVTSSTPPPTSSTSTSSSAAPPTSTTPTVTSTPPPSSTSSPGTMSTSTAPNPSSSSAMSSKLVTSTWTSTKPDGGVVIVTATTYVGADSGGTPAAGSAASTGNLQTNAGSAHRGLHIGGLLTIGAVLGGLFLA